HFAQRLRSEAQLPGGRHALLEVHLVAPHQSGKALRIQAEFGGPGQLLAEIRFRAVVAALEADRDWRGGHDARFRLGPRIRVRSDFLPRRFQGRGYLLVGCSVWGRTLLAEVRPGGEGTRLFRLRVFLT